MITYISPAEMLTYLSLNYVSTDPLRVQWEAMSEADQTVYLHKAFKQINALPFAGKPKEANQALPFPRYGKWTDGDWELVKNAQAEQALALTDTVAASEIEDRMRLRRAGVTEYTIGDLHEKFNGGAPADSNANFFGLCKAAYDALSKWLKGGYKICTSIKRPYGIQWWIRE